MQQQFFVHLKMKIVATIARIASAEHTDIAISAVSVTLGSTGKGKQKKTKSKEKNIHEM